jgi:16S rRNA U516 pseudouridylate synthase RsuA-like enzyme
VIHLDRRAYAGITAGRLARGEWRALTPDEVEALHRA